MSKPVNSESAPRTEFERWLRSRARFGIVVDVDAWALMLGDDGTDEPRAIVELKRSHMRVGEWAPFDADRPQYALALNFARAAGVPLLVVYYQMVDDGAGALTDDSTLSVWRMLEARPSYRYTDDSPTLISAGAFAERMRTFCRVSRQPPRRVNGS